jgi:hypothetical protein
MRAAPGSRFFRDPVDFLGVFESMRVLRALWVLGGSFCLFFSCPGFTSTCRPGGPPHYATGDGAVTYDFYGAKTRLAGADPATFKALPRPPHALAPCEHEADEFYGADRGHVFYEGKVVPGADPASFRPLAEYEYGADGSSVFYQGKKLEGADPASFRILLWPREAPGAKPGSVYLKRPSGENFSIYAADARHVWEQGRPMPGLDAATFALLPMDYTKDKNGVYRNDRLVPGLDPSTFDGTQQH